MNTCNSEFGGEEHTWKGWLSDNINTTATYSGCITTNSSSGSVVMNGSYANRTQNNTAATVLRSRIEGWEEDFGSTCNYDTGGSPFNSDDCFISQICTFPFAVHKKIMKTSSLHFNDQDQSYIASVARHKSSLVFLTFTYY